jgi:tetratricopeptide (TPR) repeat protein
VRARRIADTNIQLGIAYMRQGDYDTALVKLQKALKADPDSATANGTLALLYENIGENELAEKHFMTALRLSPEDPQTHNNYGQYLCRHGEYTQALEQFKMRPATRSIPALRRLSRMPASVPACPDASRRRTISARPWNTIRTGYALLQMANLCSRRAIT